MTEPKAESRRIRGVLFDKDGTLFDYNMTWVPIILEAARLTASGDDDLAGRLMAAGGYDAASGKVKAGSIIAAGDTPDLVEIWLAHVEGWRADDLLAKLDALFTARAADASVPVTDLPGLFGVLRTRGYSLGIATNDGKASALATIDRFGLADHLEFHCGYDSGYGSKPAPGMVHAFCEAVGLAPAHVAVVGDNKHDFDMASAAGVGLKVGVLTGTSAAEDLAPHTDVVIDSVEELPALLDLFEQAAS
jgi:phosphoglycolate phosphatase